MVDEIAVNLVPVQRVLVILEWPPVLVELRARAFALALALVGDRQQRRHILLTDGVTMQSQSWAYADSAPASLTPRRLHVVGKRPGSVRPWSPY